MTGGTGKNYQVPALELIFRQFVYLFRDCANIARFLMFIHLHAKIAYLWPEALCNNCIRPSSLSGEY